MVALEVIERAPAPHLLALPLDPEPSGLVLLPDTVSPVGDELVAGFRDGTQELRVAAIEQGISAAVVRPDGTKPGHYSEHAADWVLPIVQGVVSGAVANLVSGYVQRRWAAWKQSGQSRDPIIRFRELTESASGERRLTEVEGPAPEMLTWLSEERGATVELSSGDDDAR